MTRFLTSVSLALCVAGGLAAVAVAQPARGGIEVFSRTVPLGDLNLQTQAGAKVAAQRIRMAADYVCGGDTWPPNVGFYNCKEDAIDRAAASLNAPLVSARLGRTTSTGFASR